MAEDRPTDTTRWEKVPGGLARGDNAPGMPSAYRPPEIEARLNAPKLVQRKGIPWWKQLPDYPKPPEECLAGLRRSACMPLPAARPNHLTIDHAGQRWSGEWRLIGGEVHLASAYGSAERPAGRRKPELVAADLLRDCVETWRGRRRNP